MTNDISSQTRELLVIWFGNLELAALLENRLHNFIIQKRPAPVTFFDKITINMTSCSEVEEAGSGRQENSSAEIGKTLAALAAMPVRLNWG